MPTKSLNPSFYKIHTKPQANILLALAIVLSGCAKQANIQKTAQSSATSINKVSSTDLSSGWTVADHLGSENGDKAAYCIEKSDTTWRLTKSCNTNLDNTDIIVVDRHSKTLYLGARQLGENVVKCGYLVKKLPENVWRCYYGAFTGDRKECGYNPCLSNLTYTPKDAGSAVRETLANAITLTPLTGTTTLSRYIDKEGLFAAAQQVNLFEVVYRDAFSAAKTATNYQHFIDDYRNNDPDNLVSQASQRKDELLRQANEEAAQQKSRQEAAARQKALYAEAHHAAVLRETRSFRQSLKLGDKTNCGPIIEVKGPLVKIYFPVQNYGNEHWLEIEKIYPAGVANCQFINGTYMPPTIY